MLLIVTIRLIEFSREQLTLFRVTLNCLSQGDSLCRSEPLRLEFPDAASLLPTPSGSFDCALAPASLVLAQDDRRLVYFFTTKLITAQASPI